MSLVGEMKIDLATGRFPLYSLLIQKYHHNMIIYQSID